MRAQSAPRVMQALLRPEIAQQLAAPGSPSLTQLQHNLGFPQQPHGLYDELRHRCGSRFSDAHYLYGLPTARFQQLPSARHSAVLAANGERMPANHLRLGQQLRLIVSQYPRAEQLESHFLALHQQQARLLLVLASSQDMQQASLPAYFRRSGQYGAVKIRAYPALSTIRPQGLRQENSQLLIHTTDGQTTLPVIHIDHWQQQQTLNADTLLTLAQAIMPYGNGSPLWVHGVEGIGRSALLIAAMSLLSPEVHSLESVVTSLRIERSPNMISTPQQLALLAELATKLNVPLLDRDAIRPTQRWRVSPSV
jgi:hypothetical protein